jgi:TPR repeat protein
MHPVKALISLRRAAKRAEADEVEDDYQLALMYWLGKGTERDYAKAMQYAWGAGNRGHAKAQSLLGEMFQNGLGTTKDEIEAYKWFTLAANSGDSIGWRRHWGLVKRLDPDQITEGHRRAEAFAHTKIVIQQPRIEWPQEALKRKKSDRGFAIGLLIYVAGFSLLKISNVITISWWWMVLIPLSPTLLILTILLLIYLPCKAWTVFGKRKG